MTETAGPVAINYKEHNRCSSVGEILDVNEVMIRNEDEDGIGQVCIRGSNVFGGYLGEETSANFDGEYFVTGDLGYVRNGYLYVTGREKGILIGANGKNISQEELKNKILKCDQIHDCRVVMENDRLIAIINTQLSESECRKYFERLNRTLPNYKKIADFRITTKRIK